MAGEIVPVEQDHARATYVKKLTKDEGVVDLDRASAERVRDHIRAMAAWPRRLDPVDVPERARAAAARPAPRRGARGRRTPVAEGTPGLVVAAGKDGIDVACNDGVLRVLRLQAPGGKPMSAREFLNGRPITGGDRFG